jgi:hypothetical protein
MTKPEVSLIEQLTQIRQSLQEERENLLERVATIDQALAVTPSPKPAQKPTNKGPNLLRTPRSGGIKEAVLVAVTGTPGLTIREIQTLLSEHPAKSVESVVHSLASAGTLAKDGSSPRKFSLAAVTEPKAKSNAAAKAVGATA